MATIRNPIEWSRDQISEATDHLGSIADALVGTAGEREQRAPAIRRIDTEDLFEALRKGAADFAACRSDVVFICVIYPAIGICLAWFFFDYELLPLIFPAASGFALLGPVAAIGLYELSRRRERGEQARWSDAFRLVASPSFGAILVLGFGLVLTFGAWMVAAQLLYAATLGPEPPASVGEFVRAVLFTGPGWVMTVLGFAIGFGFAAAVLAVSVVSFPMLVERNVGLRMAVTTSVRVALANPVAIATWGLIVAVGLAVGSIPLFLGLVVVVPVLGHATWHLYRRAVSFGPDDAAPPV